MRPPNHDREELLQAMKRVARRVGQHGAIELREIPTPIIGVTHVASTKVGRGTRVEGAGRTPLEAVLDLDRAVRKARRGR